VTIAPSVSNEDARRLYLGGWNEQRPYRRTVKQPA
jgi:hypothetical protein